MSNFFGMPHKILNKRTLLFLFCASPIVLLSAPFFSTIFLGAALGTITLRLRMLGTKRLHLRPGVSHRLAPTVIFLPIVLIVAFVSWQISRGITFLKREAPWTRLDEWTDRLLGSQWVLEMREALSMGKKDVEEVSSSILQKTISNIGDPIAAFFEKLPINLLHALVLFVTFLFVYVGGRSLRQKAESLHFVPRNYLHTLFESFSDFSWTAFIAFGVTAILQGAILLVGAFASRTPEPFIFGTLGAITSVFPYIGTFPASALALATLYFTDASVTRMLILLAFAVLAGISDNLIRPILLGNTARIHPWLAFIAVLGGIAIWGFSGVFVGPILAGVSLSLCREILKDPSTELGESGPRSTIALGRGIMLPDDSVNRIP
jgi:predicted PurR-regulated permease PerM